MVSDDATKHAAILKESLNPCSNGIWSLTIGVMPGCPIILCVLILVLMEYGL